ncbi:histone-fold-containing protein [Piedraia hortae CBS 480.64]|uniref:Histone-fold-containing protein n=1 Tax=Piedraia hortae CBS 480.64 TaxID=1314780 RepID=A0A6A7C1P7_9PEZI|nr:histone-fold-containing protein [Piedraia hortae CBS 480.64]
MQNPYPNQPAAATVKQDEADEVPEYKTTNVGHFSACTALVNANAHPPAERFTGIWSNVSQGLSNHPRDILNTYWSEQMRRIEKDDHDYKVHQLPLARIKKVMKADPDVKMISAEAPILFAKGCDLFITELTMRAWIHAEENKRRTLQRSDIASALAKSDMFDFLIDIVPREEATPQHKRRPDFTSSQYVSAESSTQAATQPSANVQPAPEQTNMGDFGNQPAHNYVQQAGMYSAPGPQSMYGGQQMYENNIYGQQYAMGQMGPQPSPPQ